MIQSFFFYFTSGDVIPIFDPATQRYVWLPARDFYVMKHKDTISDIESEGGIGVRRKKGRTFNEFNGLKKYSDSGVDYGRLASPPGTPNYTETKVNNILSKTFCHFWSFNVYKYSNTIYQF